MFLLETGVRAKDCRMLSIGDVDFRTGEVTILHPKNGRTRYTHPTPYVVKHIDRYLAHRGDELAESAPLWVTRDEERLSCWDLRQIVERRSERLGITMPALHGFRRAFATAKNQAGVTALDLKDMLGHRDLQTIRRYVDEDQEHLRRLQRQTSPVAKYLT
jgi:site-specific recombinase XerD